jgi:hypothetical protein
MGKFEKLFKQIINEDIISEIDPRDMSDSIGWEATSGLLTDIYDFSTMDEESYNAWLESQPPERVEFKTGAKEVMNYAKERGADEEELAGLRQALIEFGRTHKGRTFFLYGIETDLSLGVI